MPNKFYVEIPVKPYVKRHIELRYGLPADFSKHPDIQKEVRRCLRKPQTRRDNQFDEKLCTYTESIEIVISQDDFYRYGWEFSRTDIVDFGKMFEDDIKQKMYAMVNIYRNCGMNIKNSIIRYQEQTNMSEEYWPMESIKKDYYRNAPKENFDLIDNLISKIDELFMGTLSRKKDNMPLQKTTV